LLESLARAAERSEHRRATEHEALAHGGEHEHAGAVTGAGASLHSLQLRQGQVARADWGVEQRRDAAELLAEQQRLEAEKEALRQRLEAEAAAAAAAARAKAEKERQKLEESQARAIARAEMRRSGSKVMQQQQQQQAETSWLPSWLSAAG
jgi:regulator of protease activity HflC (stomatin/prohibitin superfamily)